MACAFDALGHQVVIPSSDYKVTHWPQPPVKPFVWNQSWTQEKINAEFRTKNVLALNKEQILDLKPEIVFITAFENQFEILNEIWPHLKHKSKLVFYSGNDYWDSAYPWFLIKNYLCADNLAKSLCERHGVNHLYYRPWVDYAHYTYQGVSDANALGTYICGYQGNFPKEYEFYQQITKNLTAKFGTAFNLHESSTKEQIKDSLVNSVASLHIKGLEGFGYAIIESMACGRPVFLHRQLAKNKSYLNWAFENDTCFYFESLEEITAKLGALLACAEYRNWIQSNTAHRIRQLINNEEQTAKLGKFLGNLL